MRLTSSDLSSNSDLASGTYADLKAIRTTCNIYTLYSDLSSEEFEVCSNHKFKSFLIELDEIFNKWSIDYINYESDYDDYIEY